MNLYTIYEYEVLIKARAKKTSPARQHTYAAYGCDVASAEDFVRRKADKAGKIFVRVLESNIKRIAFAFDQDAVDINLMSREQLDAMWLTDPKNPNRTEPHHLLDLKKALGE